MEEEYMKCTVGGTIMKGISQSDFLPWPPYWCVNACRCSKIQYLTWIRLASNALLKQEEN